MVLDWVCTILEPQQAWKSYPYFSKVESTYHTYLLETIFLKIYDLQRLQYYSQIVFLGFLYFLGLGSEGTIPFISATMAHGSCRSLHWYCYRKSSSLAHPMLLFLFGDLLVCNTLMLVILGVFFAGLPAVSRWKTQMLLQDSEKLIPNTPILSTRVEFI